MAIKNIIQSLAPSVWETIFVMSAGLVCSAVYLRLFFVCPLYLTYNPHVFYCCEYKGTILYRIHDGLQRVWKYVSTREIKDLKVTEQIKTAQNIHAIKTKRVETGLSERNIY